MNVGPTLRKNRLLSLDGGGVRGLSSLMILDDIMKSLNAQLSSKGHSIVEPYQAFDLIYGTSAGGLSAMMLAKLKMPIAACISTLKDFSNAVFGHGYTYAGFLTRGWVFKRMPRFSPNAVENALLAVPGTQANLRRATPDECQCYAVCTEVNSRGQRQSVVPVCLANFHNTELTCPIWEVGRATSAAPTYFPPTNINDSHASRLRGQRKRYFQDGALTRCNNPIKTYDSFQQEWLQLNPEYSPIYVSIGTGKPSELQVERARRWYEIRLSLPVLFQAASNTAEIATDTEMDHILFESDLRRRRAQGEYGIDYYRFNCEDALANIDLAANGKMGKIEDLTTEYIQDVHGWYGYREKRRFCVLALETALRS